MWRSEKAEYLKDGRDYSSLLDVPVDSEPSREKQDFLLRRQKLEELLKSKQKNRSSSSKPDPGTPRGRSEAGSSNQRPREELPFDKTFGSFFGPSEPVLARSYIEKQRNRDDSGLAAARLAKQKQAERKSSTSTSKPVLKSKVPVKPLTKIKQKAQKLKEARDYSCLFSEGGDAAPQSKTPAKERTGHDRQPVSSKSAKETSRPALAPTINRKPARQPAPKQQSRANDTLRKPPGQSKQVKGPSSVQGRDNGRPKQPVLSRSSKEPSRIAPATNQKVSRPSDALRRSLPSSLSLKQKPLSSSSRLPEKKSTTSSKSLDTKRPLPTNQLKRPSQVAKRPEYDRPAKRPKREESPASSFVDDDEDSYENYRSLLPPQFRMKSRRVPDDDDYDSSDMEVGFSTIQQEEARSARIAREEDERERLLIEEEERLERERLRKKQKR